MHRIVGKLFVAILLTLCVAIHVLELSGQWDRTFQDANDEAGIVAVVLCVGAAVAVARTLLRRLQTRTPCPMVVRACSAILRFDGFRIPVPIPLASLPLVPLRI